jgi:hypothetical protein
MLCRKEVLNENGKEEETKKLSDNRFLIDKPYKNSYISFIRVVFMKEKRRWHDVFFLFKQA